MKRAAAGVVAADDGGARKRRRARGGKQRQPRTGLSADGKFQVAEVVEELVRDVCAGASLLPLPMWPCDDHMPCDEVWYVYG